MSRPLSLFAPLLLGAMAPAVAQVATPPAASAPTGAGSAATIRTSTQLVVVDVVVTGKGMKPLRGLKVTDFALTEGSVPQVIRRFEEHSALSPADAAELPPMPKLPPGVYSNYTPVPASGAVNLLLLDSLNTPINDQTYVRQQLVAYLKAVSPDTRIAIFGLTSRLTVLQSFTSDPEMLKNVISKKLGKASPMLADTSGIQNSAADALEDTGTDPAMVANLRQFEAQEQVTQLELRAQLTLDAMNNIARYLAAIPGRKNLIWFSGSFPINVLPDITGTVPDPFAAIASSEDEFRSTVNLLARSQVAVYPIDARGLFINPIFDASTMRNYGGATGTARMNQDQNKFFNDTAEEHQTMRAMAEATGGRAFLDTNSLTKAVADAIDDGSNFYTLTYAPANYKPDGRLHKIKVEVPGQGLTLAYRHGYYADSPDSGKLRGPRPDAAVTKAAGPTSREVMHMALTRGAPIPSEILIRVGIYPVTPAGQTEDKAAPGNSPVAKAPGPFRRYNVGFAITPTDIAYLRTSDGKVRADFSLVIFVYDPDGAVVNSVAEDIHINATPDELRKTIAHGMQYDLQVSAPAKGEYFFRMAVRDLNRDHYGAVEVATSDLKHVLPPAAAKLIPTSAVTP